MVNRMAHDPNFDRYKGIKSLPGDPLNPRRPRPFRVDEHGKVIYLDDIRPIVSRGLPGGQSKSLMVPAMFVNLSDEAESNNWEARDRNGNTVNGPHGPMIGGSGRGRGGGGGGGWGDDSAHKPKPKNRSKPRQ